MTEQPLGEADLEGMYLALKERGYSDEKANLYAGLIGDVIDVAPDGKWIFSRKGVEFDRVDPLFEI